MEYDLEKRTLELGKRIITNKRIVIARQPKQSIYLEIATGKALAMTDWIPGQARNDRFFGL